MHQLVLKNPTGLLNNSSVGAVGEEDYTQKLRAALPEFEMPPAWVTNHEPFQIIGNLYGVGGQDLAGYFNS